MKPYYQESGITIYHGDCREILPTLPRVDLVLTDPPYGIRLENHGAGKERRAESFNIRGDYSGELGEFICSAWTGPMVVFASPKSPWPGAWRQYLVWDKGPAVGGGGDVAKCWKYDWELIQIRNTGNLEGQRDSSVLRYWITPATSKDHPAQKPLELIQYLLWKVKSKIILDPFMGSGTTLLAAKNLGLQAIGIEIEEQYCEIAAQRLSQTVIKFPKPIKENKAMEDDHDFLFGRIKQAEQTAD